MVEECNAAVSRWVSRWLIHVKLNRGTLGFVYDPYRRFTCQRMLRKSKKAKNRRRQYGLGRGHERRRFITSMNSALSGSTWDTRVAGYRNGGPMADVSETFPKYVQSHRKHASCTIYMITLYTGERHRTRCAHTVVLLFCSVCLEWRENGAAAMSRETFTSARTSRSRRGCPANIDILLFWSFGCAIR